MIIKGNRGQAPPEEESRHAPPAQPQRESALIKNRGVVLPSPRDTGAQQLRRSVVLKRGTYVHSNADTPEADAPKLDIEPDTRAPVQIAEPLSAPPIPTPTGPPPDQALLEDARRNAEALVRQAHLDARKMLDESKIHCHNALQQAEREGFEAGRQQGYQASQAELGNLILQVRQMLIDTVYGREKVLLSAEGEIARLALQVAERVTATAVTTNPEVIKSQVAAALERIKDRETIIVRVNPQDLDVVRSRRDIFLKLLEGPKTFEIQGDPKVDRGGVMIETNLGNVDARITTQMQALVNAFAEVERRQREAWEHSAQAAAAQVAEQGLPPHMAAMAQQLPPMHDYGTAQ